MAINARSDSPLSLGERAGVRAPLATTFQWKRLRRFPRYGAAPTRIAAMGRSYRYIVLL